MPANDPVRQAVTVAREVSERLMPDVALVERWSEPGPFDAGTGGHDPPGGWQTVAQTVDPLTGRVDLAGDRADDRRVAERFDIVEPLAAALPAAVVVAQGDRVTVAGRALIVRAVQDASYRAHTRVVGEAVSEGA